MKTKCTWNIRILLAAISLAILPGCGGGDDDSAGSTTPPLASGTSPGNPSTSGSTPSPAPTNSTSTPPPASTNTPSMPTPAQLVGTWQAPKEALGAGQVQYSVTLNGDGSAVYATADYGQLLVFGTPTDGAILSHATGSWNLAGLNLILSSPTPAMDGTGEIQPLDRRWEAMQVEINGRIYRKL
jgi:hypothetical protein